MYATATESNVRYRHGMSIGQGNGRDPLTDDQIRKVAPSVFADKPWQGMTDKYLFVPTAEIVGAMRREGFEVVQALQGKTRIEGKGEFTKHMLRFALPKTLSVHGSVPELVLVNSHDGTSSYRLIMGIFRLICKNGLLVASDVVADLRFRHAKSLADEIIEGTGTLVREVPRVNDQIERLSGIELRSHERLAFANAAHHLRWSDGHSPVRPEQLLETRRREDEATDLYTTSNVVQENLIRGGLHGRTATRQRTKTRAVQGVTENIRLNEALAILANTLAREKAN